MATTYINGPRDAYDYETLTVDNTVGGVALTATKVTKFNSTTGQRVLCEEVFITAETAQIRWTIDGTAPTTTVGHLMNSGDSLNLPGFGNISRFRAIRTGGSSGTLQVTYHG